MSLLQHVTLGRSDVIGGSCRLRGVPFSTPHFHLMEMLMVCSVTLQPIDDNDTTILSTHYLPAHFAVAPDLYTGHKAKYVRQLP
jgi:hypothetical protein